MCWNNKQYSESCLVWVTVKSTVQKCGKLDVIVRCLKENKVIIRTCESLSVWRRYNRVGS